MCKKILSFSVLTILCLQLSAQFPGGWGGNKGPKIKGKITGQIIDSISQENIGFATVVLTKAGKTKEINGMLSEEDGKFKISEVGDGKYDLIISFLGYADKKLTDVELTPKKPDVDLGQILLRPTDYLLDEVEITEKRTLIENKVDKIVYNAEDDSSIAGGDATDVLRKVPTLSVDLDGNVSLRGSSAVRILINGKPSGMFSSNVADALKMFPADQIKKVEVITAPGAKYDGEGSAGIINIVTKKENIEGIAGSISGSAGNRQSNASLTLNAGKGRFGFSSSGNMFYSSPVDARITSLRTPLSSPMDTSYFHSGVTNTSRIGFSGSASAFYDFNAYNAINSSFTLRGYSFDQDGITNGFFNTDFTNPNSFSRANTNNNLVSGYDWNTDYTKKFEDNDKQELTFAVQLSGNVQNQDNNVLETGFLSRNENITNEGDNVEFTSQVDYVHPVGKSNKVEVGVKSVIRNINSDSRFIPVSQAEFGNVFLYDQNVYAGYLSYNFFFKKLNIVTGARFERTEIAGNGDLSEQNFTNSYNNVLPNIAISKTLKNFRTLKISFSRRIQRPSLYYINPFNNNTDFSNVVVGNPFLDPELSNQIELGYNTNFKGFTIFGSLYYKNQTDIIEQQSRLGSTTVNGIQEDIVVSSFANVGTNNSVGLNIFTSKSIGKLTLRGGGDLYTYNGRGTNADGSFAENNALSYRLFTNGEFSFSSSIKADFFGFFQAPRFTLQGENASFSIFGIGFRKDFKNASLGIRIIEPFAANKNFDSDISASSFRNQTTFELPFRSIGINFRYKFGKVDFKKRRSKIKNSDQKQGEGDGGGGGGMQGGMNNQG